MLEKLLQPGADSSWLPTEQFDRCRSSEIETSECAKEGIHEGRHKYLPFIKDRVNYVVAQNQDVISYNFSGCIMATHKRNGVRRVCHVSTGGDGDCKESWERIKKTSSEVFEFRPHEFIDIEGLFKKASTYAFVGCYGLITSDLRTFSISIGRNLASKKLVVLDLKVAHLLRK